MCTNGIAKLTGVLGDKEVKKSTVVESWVKNSLTIKSEIFNHRSPLIKRFNYSARGIWNSSQRSALRVLCLIIMADNRFDILLRIPGSIDSVRPWCCCNWGLNWTRIIIIAPSIIFSRHKRQIRRQKFSHHTYRKVETGPFHIEWNPFKSVCV